MTTSPLFTASAFDAAGAPVPDAPVWDGPRDLFAGYPLVLQTKPGLTRKEEKTILGDLLAAQWWKPLIGRNKVRLVPSNVTQIQVAPPGARLWPRVRRYDIRPLSGRDTTLHGTGEWEGQPFTLRVHSRNPWPMLGYRDVQLLALREEVPWQLQPGGQPENPHLAAAVEAAFGRRRCVIVGAHLQFAEAVRVL